MEENREKLEQLGKESGCLDQTQSVFDCLDKYVNEWRLCKNEITIYGTCLR